MSTSFELQKLPVGFTGIVRLFPLPNLVLFPGVIQPLHIFEPRYRQLMEDALAADELIAMALMRPGWEEHYEESPPIFPTVCIGRIMTHTRLEDGRYNLLLQGVQRGRIVREIATDRLYRMAEIRLPTENPSAADPALRAACESLRSRFLEVSRREGVLDDEAVRCLAAEHLPPGTLADLIAFSMEISPVIKQQVLDTFDPGERVEMVTRQLQRFVQSRHTEQAHSGFPPCFSPN